MLFHMKNLLSVSVLLLAASFTSAAPPQVVVKVDDTQVSIPKECWVQNRTGGQCVWCCVECLARKHKIKSCYDLTSRFKGIANPGDVTRELEARGMKPGVHYYQSFFGMRDRNFFINSCKHGWGAAASLNGGGNISHLVNVVHFKDGKVRIIDNMRLDRGVQEMPERVFMAYWDGWAFCLVPPK